MATMGIGMAVISPASTRGDAYWLVAGGTLALISLIGLVRELRVPGSTTKGGQFSLMDSNPCEPVRPFGLGWKAIALFVLVLLIVNAVLTIVV